MNEEATTVVVQRYLDELAGDTPAEPVVRALLDRAVRRLHQLCAALLRRDYPNDFWLNFELGMHFQVDDDPTAVSYYRAALALRPDAPWAHYYLGLNLSDMGKSDDAIHHLQRTVALDPNNGWAQSRLGDLLLAKGLVEQSLTHLEAAAELIPDWPVPKIRLQEVPPGTRQRGRGELGQGA